MAIEDLLRESRQIPSIPLIERGLHQAGWAGKKRVMFFLVNANPKVCASF